MANQWGYGEKNGPETWPKCFPEAAGYRQSPVDIKPIDLKSLKKKLTWKYVAENTEYITNTGYGWKVHVNEEGSSLTGGPLEGTYVLEQFHCHWGRTDDEGSEHTIEGKHFSGELHLVHWNKTKYSSMSEAAKHPDGLCVLGIFLKVGKRHSEIDKIVAQIPKVQYKDQTCKISSPLNPAAFIQEESSFYTYQGSLTTPPCSECVIWIVFKEPIEVSREQLKAFRSLKSYGVLDECPDDDFDGFIKTNYRPTLPLGPRVIVECKQ